MFSRVVIILLCLLWCSAKVWAAIAPVACTSAVNAGNGNVSLAMPTGTVQGNVMLTVIGGESTNLPATLTGWTIIGTCTGDGGGGVNCDYYRVAGASEAGPYAWTSAAPAGWVSGAVCTFSGENTTTPIRVSGTTNQGSSTTPTIPSVSAVSGDYLVGMWQLGNVTFTKPTDMTLGINLPQVSGTNEGVAISYKSITSTGATGTDAATMSTTGTWTAQSVDLEPAAVTGYIWP